MRLPANGSEENCPRNGLGLAIIQREFGITYLNARDASGKVAVDYGVWGIPESFFINREGRIGYKHVGAINTPTIVAKLDEAMEGIVSTDEGQGNFSSIR